MIALIALALLYLACAFITLSWAGGFALAMVVLFLVWTIHPFGNRFELRAALRWWRRVLTGRAAA